MKGTRRNGLRLPAALVAALTVATCHRPPAEHVALGPSMDALRTAFEADSGKVRAIFLASPT